MGPLFVVFPHPLRTDLAHLIQRLEHVGVEHLVAEGPIESFHESILVRLARLNMPQGDPSDGIPTAIPRAAPSSGIVSTWQRARFFVLAGGVVAVCVVLADGCRYVKPTPTGYRSLGKSVKANAVDSDSRLDRR